MTSHLFPPDDAEGAPGARGVSVAGNVLGPLAAGRGVVVAGLVKAESGSEVGGAEIGGTPPVSTGIAGDWKKKYPTTAITQHNNSSTIAMIGKGKDRKSLSRPPIIDTGMPPPDMSSVPPIERGAEGAPSSSRRRMGASARSRPPAPEPSPRRRRVTSTFSLSSELNKRIGRWSTLRVIPASATAGSGVNGVNFEVKVRMNEN